MRDVFDKLGRCLSLTDRSGMDARAPAGALSAKAEPCYSFGPVTRKAVKSPSFGEMTVFSACTILKTC